MISSGNCGTRLSDIRNDATQIPPRERDVWLAGNVEDAEERSAILLRGSDGERGGYLGVNPSHGAVKSAISAAAAYAEFLAAIAARDFDRIYALATGCVRGGLRNLQLCTDFAVLFGLWCESYPESVRSVALYCDEHIAVFDIVGDVDGAPVRARIRLRRCADRWLVDKEQFTALHRVRISRSEEIF